MAAILGAFRAGGGSGAPTTPRLATVASVLALVAMALAIAASPASATYLHEPRTSVAFGPDGTNNVTNENSFYRNTIADMAIDSKRQRLYVVHDENPNDQGRNFPGARRGVFAYDISDPSHPKPLGGNFPLAIAEQRNGYDELAVDESTGDIYMLERAEECYCEPGGELYSWNWEGKGRSGYPTHIDRFGPLAIDPAGYLWVWTTQNFQYTAPNKNLTKYLPDGTFVEELEPNVSGVGAPHDLTFDPNTGDLWLQFNEGDVKFTADSGYALHTALIKPSGYLGEGGFAVDTANGVVYNAAGFNGYAVEALNEQTGQVEDRLGLGGEEYYNYEKCQGYCIPEIKPSEIRSMVFDPATGTIWVASDGRGRDYLTEEELLKGGRLEGFFGIGASDARTGAPAANGKSEATLTASVGPGEGPPVTSCRFQYVNDDSFGNVRIVSLEGATGGQFKFEGAEKWLPYNATAFEVEHSFYSDPIVTGPAGGPWRIEAREPFEMGQIDQKVTVRASELTPEGVRIHTDWDASTAPCEPAPSAGSPFEESTEVEAQLSGLGADTTYHYRVLATSAAGTVYGGIETVATTPSKVSTGAATGIEHESATLNGTVDPEGLATTYYFEYGLTREYGSTTSAPPGEDLGTTTAGDQPVSAGISSLEPGRTYHYRLVAVNPNGTSKGVDRTFTTVAAVQGVETEAATEVQRAQAMLHGKLNPAGLETHYYFEWGTTRRYGETSAAPPGTELADTSPGSQEVSFLATGLTAGTTYHYRLVATSSFGTTYGSDRTFTTDIAVKSLVTEPATEIKTEEATLNGKLDADGLPTTFYFEYGKTTGYGQAAPAPPGESVADDSPGVQPVSYALAGLEPGTTYHFRIVAENETGVTVGQDQEFTTTHGPTIEGVYSDHVTASSAELKARINPHGFATEWYFEYGLTTNYGSIVPVPHGALSGETTGQPVSVTLTGLQTSTYYFRLVAKSEWGTVVSENQSFEFSPPACPNSALRQQTGANYLPDCRAYELVTPARAGGAPIFPPAPFSAVADDHYGFSAIFNAIPGTEPPNSGRALPHSDFYVASRSVTGWHTSYVGVKGNEGLESREILWKLPAEGSPNIPADEHLEHFLTWEDRFPCCDENGSFSPFMYDAEGHQLHRLPTNADEEDLLLGASEGGFRGDGVLSGNGNHYVFSSIRKAFAPGGLTSAPGSAYDNNIETGAVEKISFNEEGEDIRQDPRVSGSETGEEFIKFRWVSPDASHVLMSVAGPPDHNCGLECTTAEENIHLYMYVRGHGTYDVSKDFEGVDRAVHYAGTARDGSEVFFTTGQRMTADDTDSSVDLFRWDESTNELTRLSAGSGDSGNADACPGSWTSHCSVEVVPISHSCLRPQTTERRECGDSVIAKETGEIYFYSPEQLDGARGVSGDRNLYVYRDGHPLFVANLEGGRPAERMNVSFDGRWMALLTRSQLTAYDNATHAEMYRYHPETRSIVCVSCRPDGEPPTSDALASFNGYFLTTDGRTFFSTEEPLVDRDADGVSDTYEYVQGRPQLISNGAEDSVQAANTNEFNPIGLMGVTADGENVFFSTFTTLVGQDENGPFYKIYDARVNGGFPYQRPPAPCAAADECHGEGNPTPAPPVIGSATNLRDRGNFTSSKKRHHAKRHHHHRKHRRRHAHRGKHRAKDRHSAKNGKHARRGQKGAGR